MTMCPRFFFSRVTIHFMVGIVLLMGSCDPLREDSIPQKISINPATYYILPGASVIIDLRSIVYPSFVYASLEIDEKPKSGTLTRMDNFLLTYVPDQEFTEGQDQFKITVAADGKYAGTGLITINVLKNSADFPCGIYAVSDTITTALETATTIRFMDNDRICGVDKLDLIASIVSKPRFGTAKINGDIIEYMPTYGFVGYDSIIYRLLNPHDDKSTYGKITINKYHSEASKNWVLLPRIPELYVNTLFFIDENTGFVGGESLYKTTDGGMHWRVVLPWAALGNNEIHDVFFIDEKNGFAAYSGNEEIGGLVKTSDGGETWERDSTPAGIISSIRFISPSVGFIGNSNGLYKTSNGGNTWKLVSGNCCAHDIQFIDEKNGFAYSGANILQTTDGGDSWIPIVLLPSISNDPNETVYGLSNNGKDLLFLFLGTIWKTEDGKNFNGYFDRYYRYYNAISFSGSGNLGVVVGQFPSGSPEALITKDGGGTWTTSLQNWPIEFALIDVSVPSDKVAYAIAQEGYVVKYDER